MLKMPLKNRVLKSFLSALALSVITTPAFAEEIEIEHNENFCTK